MTVKEKALLQKKQRRDQSTHSPVATLITLKYLVPREPGQNMEHGVSEDSSSLALWVMLRGLCTMTHLGVQAAGHLAQNAGGGVKESLVPPSTLRAIGNRSQEQSSPWGACSGDFIISSELMK